MAKKLNSTEQKLLKSELASLVAENVIDVTCHTYMGPREADRPTLRTIAECTANEYGLRFEQLGARSRVNRVLRPRQVAMWLAHRVFGHKSEAVGRYFGGRDHSTVLYASNSIDRARQEHSALEAEIQRILVAIEDNANVVAKHRLPPVSYTHLTLPTTSRV